MNKYLKTIGKVTGVFIICFMLSGCFYTDKMESKTNNNIVYCKSSDEKITTDLFLSNDLTTIRNYHYTNNLVEYSNDEYENLIINGKSDNELYKENTTIATNKEAEIKSTLPEGDTDTHINTYSSSKSVSITVDYSDKYIDQFIKKYNIQNVDELIDLFESGKVDGVTYKCENL